MIPYAMAADGWTDSNPSDYAEPAPTRDDASSSDVWEYFVSACVGSVEEMSEHPIERLWRWLHEAEDFVACEGRDR